MNLLVVLAVVLAALWFLGVAVFDVVGVVIHLALIAAVILFVVWAVQKALGRRGTAL